MNTEAISLPADLSLCHQIMATQHKQLLASQRRIEQLEHRLDLLLRRIYGPRSEHLDPNQLALFETSGHELPTVGSTAEVKLAEKTPSKTNGHGRRQFPANLERRRIVLDIAEAEKTCPCCGKPRRVIGEVVTERLGFDPARFYVNQYVQLKYACRCEQSDVEHRHAVVVVAEKPIQPIERGNAEPELVAFTAVSRFDDHSPYYRQENGQFRRAGVEISRSTQCDWMRQIAELCRPLYDLMHTLVLRSKLLGTDDTPVPVLVPGRGKTQEARLWAYRGDDHYPYDVFDFTLSRKRDGPLKFLRRDERSKDGFCGYLQADAYAGYDVLFRLGGIVEVGCWAHARRKFFEAKETNLAVGLEALARIKQLYEVEDVAKELSADERLAVRQSRAVPLLAGLKTWLDEQYGKILPRSTIGEAISYTLSNWAALTRYADDGDLPIDNNAVERMLKLIALGRKNWMFVGSERGGHTAAVLFTIISSAKRHRLNTWAYLRDVLWRLADLKPGELEQLLPDRWQDARAPVT